MTGSQKAQVDRLGKIEEGASSIVEGAAEDAMTGEDETTIACFKWVEAWPRLTARSRSGKCLLAMAIVGVLLAVSTQIWEWRKSIENDRTARAKNQELLLKLDREAQLAAKSLHEVRRAVTRFQAPCAGFTEPDSESAT